MTPSAGTNRCPITRTMELWSEAENAWVSNTFSGCYTSDYGATQTATYCSSSDQSLDSSDITEAVYHYRIKFEVPLSIDASNPTYLQFSVTFNNYCDSDYFVIGQQGDIVHDLNAEDTTY